MKLTISQNGIDLIKSFEGCKLKAYKCPAGVWTIGYGHTSGVYEGMEITKAQAIEFLKQDLEKFEKTVNKQSYQLNQNQFDALVSFTYNCGAGNLSKLTANGARSIDTIAQKMLQYNKANGKVLKGLTRRRQAEYDLFVKKSVSKIDEYKLVFDADFYASTYTDLFKAFGNDKEKLFQHFLTYGMKEGRKGCAQFDVVNYKKKYQYLEGVLGNDYEEYFMHYINFGYKTGMRS